MTFPLLTLPDLLTVLSTEFPLLELSEEDFTNPTKAKWQDVYTMLLAQMTGISVIDLKSNINRQIMAVEYPDFHRAILETGILAKCLHRILTPAGIDNFGMKDITWPNRKRLVRVMSAIINFTRYQGERHADYCESNQIFQRRQDHFNALLAQKDSTLQKINDIKRVHAEQEEKAAGLKERKDKLLGAMADQQRQSEQMNKNIKDLQMRAQAVLMEQTQCAENIVSMTRESDRLESMIMQSPDRAAREKAVMEAKLEHITAMHDEKLSRISAISIATQLQRSEESRQACKLLDSINEHTARVRQIVTEIKRSGDEQQQRSAQVADLVAKIQSAKRTVAARQEKFEKQKLQQKLKDDGLKCQLHELQLAYEQLRLEGDVLERIEEDEKQLLQKIAAEREGFKSRMETMKQSRESLTQDIENYFREFCRGFDSIVSDEDNGQ